MNMSKHERTKLDWFIGLQSAGGLMMFAGYALITVPWGTQYLSTPYQFSLLVGGALLWLGSLFWLLLSPTRKDTQAG